MTIQPDCNFAVITRSFFVETKSDLNAGSINVQVEERAIFLHISAIKASITPSTDSLVYPSETINDNINSDSSLH